MGVANGFCNVKQFVARKGRLIKGNTERIHKVTLSNHRWYQSSMEALLNPQFWYRRCAEQFRPCVTTVTRVQQASAKKRSAAVTSCPPSPTPRDQSAKA